MKERYHKWYSSQLGRDLEMLVFGDRGFPVILFPTSMGSYHENRDCDLIESASWFINNGLIKIYCPDSIDKLSWYNRGVHPKMKAWNHQCYDQMLYHELAPWAMHETGKSKVAVAGCSFGGYHAVNFAFKHPDRTAYMFSMSGSYDIKSFLDGYYDDNCYFNNPVDFIPGIENEHLHEMGIVLGTSDQDICRQANEHLSGVLNAKGINHWLDMRPNAKHDWPIWREMFPHYLSWISF